MKKEERRRRLSAMFVTQENSGAMQSRTMDAIFLR